MSLQKYTSFEKASKGLWVLKPGEEYYKKLKQLFIFWNKLNQEKPVKGLQKFKKYNDFLKIKNKFSN